MRNISKSRIKHSASVSITLLIVLMLILSGPASAVKVQLKTPPTSIQLGKPVVFTVEVKLLNNDFIPIESINVSGLPLGDLSFYPDGTKIAGSSRYTVTKIKDTTQYSYGYGYGYDEEIGYGYDFGYGYGYGYDFGTGEEPKLTYDITISGLSVGTYSGTATVEVITGDMNKPAFSTSEPYRFNIFTPPVSAGRGGRGISLNFQLAVLINGIATYWGEVGKYIASIEIPGATGTVSVELMTSNPTSVQPNKHVFRFIEINAGEHSEKNGKINFKVSTDALNISGIDRNNVAIYRFKNGNWNELPARWTGTVDGYEQFSADTTGFSFFVISEKGISVTAAPEEVTATALPGGAGMEEEAEAATETEGKGIPGFGAAILVSGILTAAYILMRKRG